MVRRSCLGVFDRVHGGNGRQRRDPWQATHKWLGTFNIGGDNNGKTMMVVGNNGDKVDGWEIKNNGLIDFVDGFRFKKWEKFLGFLYQFGNFVI